MKEFILLFLFVLVMLLGLMVITTVAFYILKIIAVTVPGVLLQIAISVILIALLIAIIIYVLT